jgi:hypothetical protein
MMFATTMGILMLQMVAIKVPTTMEIMHRCDGCV